MRNTTLTGKNRSLYMDFQEIADQADILKSQVFKMSKEKSFPKSQSNGNDKKYFLKTDVMNWIEETNPKRRVEMMEQSDKISFRIEPTIVMKFQVFAGTRHIRQHFLSGKGLIRYTHWPSEAKL